MQVKISPGIEGARFATGCIVIIDVLRASSTIITALMLGARSVIPLSRVEDGFPFLDQEGYIVIGEIGDGKKVEEFHASNSPMQLFNLEIFGKQIVIRSANGTQGIVAAEGASEVLVGGFLNAKWVAEFVRGHGGATIVPIGAREGMRIEDALCAEVIRGYIQDSEYEPPPYKAEVLKSKSVNFIKENGSEEEQGDIPYCLDLNKVPIVPYVQGGKILPMVILE